MDKFNRIPPTEGNPEPLPPVGGTWRRDEDGGLTPLDQATADAAGLSLLEPEPDPELSPSPPVKRSARVAS